jgi:preprotein translocase subunit SecA
MAPLLRGYLMERKKLNVRLPADLHEDLADVAAQYDLSMNTVAVLAVRNYVGYVASRGRLPGTYPINKGTAKKQEPSVQERPERPERNEKCHCGSGKKYKVCCYPD